MGRFIKVEETGIVGVVGIVGNNENDDNGDSDVVLLWFWSNCSVVLRKSLCWVSDFLLLN